jgi:tRNA(fMet)-specific endonuclease VapC
VSFWILDTDHISLFQRRHPLVTERISPKGNDEFATTIVTYEEQMQGWLAVIRRSATPPDLIRDYAKLAFARQFFNDIHVLDFTEAAAEQYANLIKQKIRVGTQDLRIAAIALSVNGIIVTRNRQDFERVPDLQVEDWSSQ